MERCSEVEQIDGGLDSASPDVYHDWVQTEGELLRYLCGDVDQRYSRAELRRYDIDYGNHLPKDVEP